MSIAITGTFGSGKSTVAKIFRKYGYKVINVDRFYRALIKPNSELHNKLVKGFGKEILKRNKIDRKKLKKIVFNDKSKLKKLNRITHPYIIKRLKGKLTKNTVLDAPLLIEAKAQNMVDKIIVVSSGKKEIKKRLIKTGKYTMKEIEVITSSQLPLKTKLQYADYVIDNSNSLINTRKQVKSIIRSMQQN